MILPKKSKATLLVIDDDQSIRETLVAILSKTYRVLTAEDGDKGLDLIRSHEVHVVLLDLRMPTIGGLEVLEKIKELYNDIEVIMITVVQEVETAVEAMKLGAFDYIDKQFRYGEIRALVERAIERQGHQRQILYLHQEVSQLLPGEFIIGKSAKMHEVMKLAEKVAALPATVFIYGESGTGKELLARMIHQRGFGASCPFVTTDLASIPPNLIESALFGHEKGAFTGAMEQRFGKFELAKGGTIFLDEIGDLQYDMQAKLLRVLQEGMIERLGGNKQILVDARVISATHHDLDQAVKEGAFREDLFFRINMIPIRIPPLRERIEDIPELVYTFVQRFSKKFKKEVVGISDEALEVLTFYPWPGNIRELENLIGRLVATIEHKVILPEDIPIDYHLHDLQRAEGSPKSFDLLTKACETFERNLILKAIERAGSSRKMAAQKLGVPLSTLKYKMRKLAIYEKLKEQ